MNVLEVLFNKRWIIKSAEGELYYKVKDGIEPLKKFITEKLGYQIIVNPLLIKMEKLPGKPESWMGVSAFSHILEYGFLCMILMFLEDKEAEEQFVLSQLTEFIEANYEGETIDWTKYGCRRHLIKVLKFCAENGIVKVDDGSEENFAGDMNEEVLYENTGVSKYFMRTFPKDIMEFQSVEDFYQNEWAEGNEERGVIRRQRVYRRILLCLGVYRGAGDEEDFLYLRNFRNQMEAELQKLVDCTLQVHKTSAYLVIGPEGALGKSFPENNTMADILLLMNKIIREKVAQGSLPVSADEFVTVSVIEFENLIRQCKERFGIYFSKTYREKTTMEFISIVKEAMELLELIETDDLEQRVTIKPVVGKIAGDYGMPAQEEEESHVK